MRIILVVLALLLVGCDDDNLTGSGVNRVQVQGQVLGFYCPDWEPLRPYVSHFGETPQIAFVDSQNRSYAAAVDTGSLFDVRLPKETYLVVGTSRLSCTDTLGTFTVATDTSILLALHVDLLNDTLQLDFYHGSSLTMTPQQEQVWVDSFLVLTGADWFSEGPIRAPYQDNYTWITHYYFLVDPARNVWEEWPRLSAIWEAHASEFPGLIDFYPNGVRPCLAAPEDRTQEIIVTGQ